jgi:hypothetical protein
MPGGAGDVEERVGSGDDGCLGGVADGERRAGDRGEAIGADGVSADGLGGGVADVDQIGGGSGGGGSDEEAGASG